MKLLLVFWGLFLSSISSPKEVKLREIIVNIPALRSQLVELMKDGFTKIPLEDLLHIIKSTCIEGKE